MPDNSATPVGVPCSTHRSDATLNAFVIHCCKPDVDLVGSAIDDVPCHDVVKSQVPVVVVFVVVFDAEAHDRPTSMMVSLLEAGSRR